MHFDVLLGVLIAVNHGNFNLKTLSVEFIPHPVHYIIFAFSSNLSH